VTGERRDTPLFRIDVAPTATNGLRKRSQVMVDKAQNIPREKLGEQFGRLEDDRMLAVTRPVRWRCSWALPDPPMATGSGQPSLCGQSLLEERPQDGKHAPWRTREIPNSPPGVVARCQRELDFDHDGRAGVAQVEPRRSCPTAGERAGNDRGRSAAHGREADGQRQQGRPGNRRAELQV
jgi:hypothetical protein